MSEETSTPETEEVRKNKDGSIRMTFGGSTYLLRSPRLGVFRDLRQIIRDSQDRVLQVRRDRQEAGQNLTFSDVDQSDEMIKFQEKAFGELADKQLPPMDDWPAWLIGTTLPNEMLKHWQDVPLVSSSD